MASLLIYIGLPVLIAAIALGFALASSSQSGHVAASPSSAVTSSNPIKVGSGTDAEAVEANEVLVERALARMDVLLDEQRKKNDDHLDKVVQGIETRNAADPTIVSSFRTGSYSGSSMIHASIPRSRTTTVAHGENDLADAEDKLLKAIFGGVADFTTHSESQGLPAPKIELKNS